MKKLIFAIALLTVSFSGFSQIVSPLTLPDIESIWAPRVMPSVDDLNRTWSALYDRGKTLITASTFSVASSATPAVITGLTSDTLVLGASYTFEANLYAVSTGTIGVSFAMGGTATYSISIYETVLIDGAASAIVISTTNVNSLTATSYSTATLAHGYCTIKGSFTITALGNVSVKFSQANSNTADSHVLKGSTFTYRRL